MKLRPYHARGFLTALLVISAWRVYEWSCMEFAVPRREFARWCELTRQTTEELDRGVAHRYEKLAQDLNGTRDVGYISEGDKSTLWSDSSPAGFARIQRYYMAQGILTPSLLRLDERRPLVVVDCATPEQASEVLSRWGLAPIRSYAQGLILAQPGK